MTLVEHSIQLVAAAKEAGEVRQDQARADQFDNVTEALQGAYTDLERLAWFLSVLAAEGVRPSADVAQGARDGRGAVAAARHRFDEDRSWLVQDRNGLNLAQMLRAYRALVETEKVSVWRQYVSALPPGERQLVAPLLSENQSAKVKADAKAYLENETFLERILNGDPPADESAWRTFHKLLKKRDELRAGLPVPTDLDIAKFVADSQGQGARLDQLTDKIKQWLADTGQADSFRIHSRNR